MCVKLLFIRSDMKSTKRTKFTEAVSYFSFPFFCIDNDSFKDYHHGIKAKYIWRPSVLGDHLQILPRKNTIILTCIKRQSCLQRPETTFLHPYFVIHWPLFPSDLKFYVKTYFHDMGFDDKLDWINCFNGLFNFFVFHFQNSSVCNTLQAQSESACKVTNAFSIQVWVKWPPVFRGHFLRIPWVFS